MLFGEPTERAQALEDSRARLYSKLIEFQNAIPASRFSSWGARLGHTVKVLMIVN